MKKCEKCEKWFSKWNLDEGNCIFCIEPWKEHPDARVGAEFVGGEPPSYFELIDKVQFRETRYDIVLPFSHDPKNSYVAAIVYEGPRYYWHIEGRSGKFKDVQEATIEVLKTVDLKQRKMLNDEFEKEFGND